SRVSSKPSSIVTSSIQNWKGARFVSKKVLFTFSVLTAVSMIPMRAQSQDEDGKLNFSMGGGLSVPLNPIARYAGVGGSFNTGAGYNIDQHSSVLGQFNWD